MAALTDTQLSSMQVSARHRGMLEANYRAAYGGLTESPLSGEWAGDPTPASVAADAGYMGDDYDVIEAIADAWEEGYFERMAEEEEPEEED